MTSSNTPEPFLAYTVVYSARRTVGITVERDGSVVVRAPNGIDPDELQRVVSSKRRWINEKAGHPQKYRKRLHAPGKELVSGESMLYLGREYRVEVGPFPSNHIELVEGRFQVPIDSALGRREEFRRWYNRAAKEQLVPRVRERARALGVDVARVSITDTKFRWGACTPAGNIRLNWRLVKAPLPVAEYVIIHELAHLLEPNHGGRFWSIVRSQIPNVDTARAWLRDHGGVLENDL